MVEFPHTALCRYRGDGAPVVVIVVHVFVEGLYIPPELELGLPDPPQTINFDPVQTEVKNNFASGAPDVVVIVQELAAGS